MEAPQTLQPAPRKQTLRLFPLSQNTDESLCCGVPGNASVFEHDSGRLGSSSDSVSQPLAAAPGAPPERIRSNNRYCRDRSGCRCKLEPDNVHKEKNEGSPEFPLYGAGQRVQFARSLSIVIYKSQLAGKGLFRSQSLGAFCSFPSVLLHINISTQIIRDEAPLKARKLGGVCGVLFFRINRRGTRGGGCDP